METTNGNVGNCCKCGRTCQQKQTENSEVKQAEPIYCNAQPFAFTNSGIGEHTENEKEIRPASFIENAESLPLDKNEFQPTEDKELPETGATLIRVPEIELRYIRPARLKVEKHINKSTASAEMFREVIGIERMHIQEYFIALFLNRRNRPAGYTIMSKGGISGTVVDIRLLIITALKCLASGIIIMHNHPSGGIEPSDQDRSLTRKCKEAAKLFDITLLDHVIVTTDNHFSFSDKGLAGLSDQAINGLTSTDDSDKMNESDETELSGFRSQAQQFLKND